MRWQPRFYRKRLTDALVKEPRTRRPQPIRNDCSMRSVMGSGDIFNKIIGSIGPSSRLPPCVTLCGVTIEYTDRYSSGNRPSHSSVVFMSVQTFLNAIHIAELARYTDRHSSIIRMRGKPACLRRPFFVRHEAYHEHYPISPTPYALHSRICPAQSAPRSLNYLSHLLSPQPAEHLPEVLRICILS